MDPTSSAYLLHGTFSSMSLLGDAEAMVVRCLSRSAHRRPESGDEVQDPSCEFRDVVGIVETEIDIGMFARESEVRLFRPKISSLEQRACQLRQTLTSR